MALKRKQHISRLGLFLLVVLSISACQELRLLTYPADFTWIGKEQLRTTMHEMANAVSEINALLDSGGSNPSMQALIVEEIDNIETYAMSLAGGAQSRSNKSSSNHLLIDDNLDEFISIVGKARLQAQSNPANYYGVGKIAGGCSSCHRLR